MTVVTNKGPKMWNKAKTLIPGGNCLLSKRPERFLPNNWPSYFKKAKGCKIWDFDGNELIDMSIMGVGTCILGYADDDVNSAVKKVIDDGSMCTLNSPEDIELAEKLLKLHPWAGMVRYARTGGESMAVAVRIARAHTKKEKVVFCGYHGWTDWYLAANLISKDNLNQHLLTGLEPGGIPKGLTGTSIPVEYDNIEELKKIIKQEKDIAAIVIEPIRYKVPGETFFSEVKKIAEDIGAVIIFDEITSGFRTRVGGAYEDLTTNPDIVVYAKAISNGFPMGAIIGKKEIMNSAQSSFISSTYWTERTGPAAALATLKKLEKEEVPKKLIKLGKKIKQGWIELGRKHLLNVEAVGLDALATLHFLYDDKSQAILTLFTQEMLKRGYLASNQVYLSNAHSEEIIEKYLEVVDEVFEYLKKVIEKDEINDKLEGPVADFGFKRLN